MPWSHRSAPPPPARSDLRRPTRRSISVLIVAVAVGALVLPATLALARGRATRHALPRPTLTAAHNAKLNETIVIDAQGRTLYALSGETVHHLKCSSALCLRFWPALTVSSADATLRAGTGVHGKLAEYHRPDGSWQVTLRGLLLYRFAGDHGPGSAAGQSIASFGGVWHAVTAAATRPGAGQGPAPVTSTSTAAPGYVSASSATSTSGPGQSSSSTATSRVTTSTVSSSSPSSSTATSTTTTMVTTTSSYTYPYGY